MGMILVTSQATQEAGMDELHLHIHPIDLTDLMARLDTMEATMSDISSALNDLMTEVGNVTRRVDEDVRYLQDLLAEATAARADDQATIERLNREAGDTVMRITEATQQLRGVDPLADHPAVEPAPAPDPDPLVPDQIPVNEPVQPEGDEPSTPVDEPVDAEPVSGDVGTPGQPDPVVAEPEPVVDPEPAAEPVAPVVEPGADPAVEAEATDEHSGFRRPSPEDRA